MKHHHLIPGLILAGSSLLSAQNLVGQWTFENADDLTEATLGSALAFTGTITATTGVGGDGAIDVPQGSEITVTNPIGANGDGTRSNQFTIVMDFQIPSITSQWHALFDLRQTGADADYWLRKQANATELGVAAIGYVGPGAATTGDGTSGTFIEATWYRLVYTVDSGGVGRSTYLDGAYIGDNNGNNTLDYDRGSLGTVFGIFQDNTAGEHTAAIVSNIALFDDRLTDNQVAALGAAGDPMVIPVSEELTWTGATSSEWSTNILGSPKNWILTSDGATENDFENFDTLLFDDSATGTTVDISNGDMQPESVTFDNSTKSFTLTGSNGIAGPGDLILAGSNSVTINNANTFTGITYHDSGKLVIGHENALQGSTLNSYLGNSITFNGITAATLGGLTGDADISLENSSSAAVALTVNGGDSYAGSLTDSGSLTKDGSDLLVLNWTSTFSGGTTLMAGNIRLGDPAALGTGTITYSGGNQFFSFGDGSDETVANDIVLPDTGLWPFVIKGTDGANITSTTTVRLTGAISGGNPAETYRFADTDNGGNHNNVLVLSNPANSFEGTIQMWRGTLGFTSDEALGNLDNDINLVTENVLGSLRFDADGITLNPNRSISLYTTAGAMPINTQEFTGTIAGDIVSGVGNLTKQGTGTLILTGNNYATGATTVDAGTLQIDGSFELGGGIVTTNPTATLSGSGTIDRDVTINGTLAPGASVGTLTIGGELSLGAFSSLNCEISDWTGAAGTGYDTVTANGLTITATSADPITVLVTPDAIANFTDETRSFTLVSTTLGVLGYSADAFTVDASALPAATGGWTVELSGNDLVLKHSFGAASPFETWAANAGLDGSNNGIYDDPEGDKVDNTLEWILGGDPLVQDAATILPAAAGDTGNGLTLSFDREEDTINATTLLVQWNTDLSSSWNEVAVGAASSGPDDSGVSVTVDTASDPDKITVTIPASNAPNGKIFARLKATQP